MGVQLVMLTWNTGAPPDHWRRWDAPLRDCQQWGTCQGGSKSALHPALPVRECSEGSDAATPDPLPGADCGQRCNGGAPGFSFARLSAWRRNDRA
jgi:hypothetical protein